jgi:Peptidase family M1 domain
MSRGTGLSRDAESDYTLGSKTGSTTLGIRQQTGCSKTGVVMRAAIALAVAYCLTAPFAALGAEQPARARYDSLNSLRIDPSAIYQITAANRIELQRADVRLSFEEGQLGLFSALDGRITGAVFSGRGRMLAIPRGVVEKQQMAWFLGAPILDEQFTNVWLRFTDGTAQELLHELGSAGVERHEDQVFARHWDELVTLDNPTQSIRILSGDLSADAGAYFYAGIVGIRVGPFDFVLDGKRDEQLIIGQRKRIADASFYDVWTSYKVPDMAAPAPAFHALRYNIETTLRTDTSLDGKAEVRLRAETPGQRAITFSLSRQLSVDSITNERGEALEYFQNQGVRQENVGARGADYVFVVLPVAPARGSEVSVRFHYHGSVIENSGNGVLFVSARDSWYPRVGSMADFADYDLTMRWPKKLRLVATGTKIDEHDEGESRTGHWRTDRPSSLAGFNVGEYVSAAVTSETHAIELFANRELEQALQEKMEHAQPHNDIAIAAPVGSTRFGAGNRMELPTIQPSPADSLKVLAREVDSSIRFYEAFNGPFPFQKLNISQIPGSFGQGWPGLLYLSTYSFLPAQAVQRAGITQTGQQMMTELMPFHEVAHQWWGNVVGWDSYRDQWIDESIANYLALLFANSQKNENHSLRVWLDRYRRSLIEKQPDGGVPLTEIGALDIGGRLTSSKAPAGFEDVIYGKGAWVIHMLRELLQDPTGKNPDARFNSLLRSLQEKYAYRGLSTADLQHEVERVMTPQMDLEGGRSMEWFFEQWVRGTGIPRYHVEFTARPDEKGFAIRGKLRQRGVPHSFVAPVPLYANFGSGRAVKLGVVVAGGEETAFHFTVPSVPHKILIDPQNTLLCVTE